MASCKRPIWRLAYPDFSSKFPHQLRDSSLAHLKLGIRKRSSELEPLQLNPVGANLRDIVMHLLREPALGASPEDLGKPHGHFGRNSALPIHEFRQSGAGDAQRGGRVLDRQAQRFNALAQHKTARVWWILHRHSSASTDGNRFNQRPELRGLILNFGCRTLALFARVRFSASNTWDKSPTLSQRRERMGHPSN